MKVFVTGASGWIGAAAVDELLAGAHDVVALARSDASAAALAQKGVTVRRGDLDDLGSLRAGAEEADAVLHLANKHDWADPKRSDAAERAAVQTFGDALVGTGKPFLLASGVAGLAQGRPATEEDPSPWSGPDAPRGGSESLALEFVDRGVTAIPVRFAPTVHGAGDHGFIAAIVAAARRQGASGYIGDGTSAWSAVARTDAARLLRLALEQATPGLVVHAVAEEAVPARTIAEAVGRGLDIPVTSVDPDGAAEWFGFIGRFFGADCSASSTRTRQRLGWSPSGATLLEDLEAGPYFRV